MKKIRNWFKDKKYRLYEQSIAFILRKAFEFPAHVKRSSRNIELEQNDVVYAWNMRKKTIEAESEIHKIGLTYDKFNIYLLKQINDEIKGLIKYTKKDSSIDTKIMDSNENLEIGIKTSKTHASNSITIESYISKNGKNTTFYKNNS
ncbi:hypothetical protein K9L67_03835 [Candidatus Woesearchaeota archaeon]|nr:hypothetical protein [Candidatus Woesearchaeota archaeon]MCF7901333.1 hypothetical protein [Candidatus Woesearchaeota archaeon]